MREVLLARYDNSSSNPNVLREGAALRYGDSCVETKLVHALSTALYTGYVTSEIVLVKQVELRPDTASSGQVVALCEPLEVQHRRLKKWEMPL